MIALFSYCIYPFDIALYRSRDFASAEATRGLSGRPLDPFGFATTGVDFFRSRGNRACGRDEGAFRSPPRPLRSALPCLLTFAGRFLVSGLFGLPLKPQKYAKNQHKHPIWHESCCRTGRFSCKNPLQNQQKTGTIEQEDGKNRFPGKAWNAWICST